MTSTPSPLGRPLTASGSLPGSPLGAEKTRRYDRQLRLWGDHGQTALEAAKLCLIHAGATGSEVLKSLVLPGVGAFTIVDGQRVTGSDVGNNFFLEPGELVGWLVCQSGLDTWSTHKPRTPEFLVKARIAEERLIRHIWMSLIQFSYRKTASFYWWRLWVGL